MVEGILSWILKIPRSDQNKIYFGTVQRTVMEMKLFWEVDCVWNGNLDTLGFTLEPSSYPASPSLHSKDLPALSPHVADHELTRVPSASSDHSKTRLGEHDEDYHELSPSPTNLADRRSDVPIPDSRPLVIVSPLNAEAHAVVPVSPKISRSELSQRRTRRPFSVAEVEALVEAVEELGTGRYPNYNILFCNNATPLPHNKEKLSQFVILR
ncbi:hypothetical protein HAX54_039225 [Datura stramonium]|uniref:Uncharacterized protein n=1 Tax=Datura stramonium TaxID=4076 RepID=A0ABS8VQ23_DATST|nr:hypothetical protein [Datura stramonium]